MHKLTLVLLICMNLLGSSEVDEQLIFDVVTHIPEIRNLLIGYLDGWPESKLPNDYIKSNKRQMQYDSRMHCLFNDNQKHNEPIRNDSRLRCLSCSNDGKYVSLVTDQNLIVLKVNELNKSFRNLNEHNDVVSAICFFNCEYIASGSKDGVVKIFNISNSECVNTIKLHSAEISKLAVTNDGNFLTSSSFDKLLKAYNIKDHVEKEFNGHTKKIMTFDFSFDGKQIASAGEEKTIKIWNFDTGVCLKTLSSHMATILSLAFFDNDKIISGGQDCMVRLWDLSLESSVGLAYAHVAVNCLLNLANTTSFISSWDGYIGLTDYQTKNLYKFHCNSGRILNVSISKPGNDIFILTDDNKILILSFPLKYLSIL